MLTARYLNPVSHTPCPATACQPLLSPLDHTAGRPAATPPALCSATVWYGEHVGAHTCTCTCTDAPYVIGPVHCQALCPWLALTCIGTCCPPCGRRLTGCVYVCARVRAGAAGGSRATYRSQRDTSCLALEVEAGAAVPFTQDLRVGVRIYQLCFNVCLLGCVNGRWV